MEKKLVSSPKRSSGESFINEMTRMINVWVHDTPIKNIALKALHVMPALLLQKPSKDSKSKDHLKSLEKRFEILKEQNLNELYGRGKSNSRSAEIRWKSK